MAEPRRAILVAAEALVLPGLRNHLAALPGLVIVASATTKNEALDAIAAHRPSLVFLRPERFPLGGISLSKLIQEQFPRVKQVIVTGRTEIDVVLAYARLGAAGFFPDDSIAEIAAYLDAIDAGHVVLGRSLACMLARLYDTPLGRAALCLGQAELPGDSDAGCGGHPDGSRRQAVLRLAGQGLTNKEIARALGMAGSTVADHLKRHRARYGPIRRATLDRPWPDADSA